MIRATESKLQFIPVATLLACLALAGCQGAAQQSLPPIGGGIPSQANESTVAACRTHADQVYDQRNRAEIYAPQSSVNTPYSANYTPGVTNRGLADQYQHQAMIRDCVRNTGTETSRETPPAPATGAVVRP